MLRKDRRRASTDARLELRRQVVELRGMGKKMIEISAITGYARSYCSTLLKKLSDEPERLEVLRRGGRPKGSKRALSAKDERTAQNLICGKFPDQWQLPFALWTRAAVRELIRVRFGVRLSVRAIGDYLARWGYTPQKAARRAYERDESRHRGYAPCGQTPIIKIPARRKSLSLIAAVTNQGKVRFMIYAGGITPGRLILFMRRLTKDARRKVFLILDNLNVHKARLIKDWLAANAKRIEVFYLPPYSPELNPSEYFNGDLKGAIQRGIPPRDQSELKRTILAQSRRIQKSPDRVRKYL